MLELAAISIYVAEFLLVAIAQIGLDRVSDKGGLTVFIATGLKPSQRVLGLQSVMTPDSDKRVRH